MALTGLTAAEVQVLGAVLEAVRRIRYGAVHVIIQDGRVVQIDRLEKERLCSPRPRETLVGDRPAAPPCG